MEKNNILSCVATARALDSMWETTGNRKRPGKDLGAEGRVVGDPSCCLGSYVFESTPISGQPTLAVTPSAFHGGTEGKEFPSTLGKGEGEDEAYSQPSPHPLPSASPCRVSPNPGVFSRLSSKVPSS